MGGFCDCKHAPEETSSSLARFLRVSSNPTAGSISLDPDQAPGRGLFAQPTVKALEASGAKTTDAGHVDRKGAAGVQALAKTALSKAAGAQLRFTKVRPRCPASLAHVPPQSRHERLTQ